MSKYEKPEMELINIDNPEIMTLQSAENSTGWLNGSDWEELFN